MRYFLLLALLYSVKSFAAYECRYDIYQRDNLKEVISSRTLTAQNTDLKSLFIHEVFKDSKSSISLKIFIDGWVGEEEMTVSAMRDQTKNEISKLVAISDKVLVRGEEKTMLWFDSYKMDIDCSFI